jgi:hypothetical protein
MISNDILIELLCIMTVLFFFTVLMSYATYTKAVERFKLEILKAKFRSGDAVFTSHPKFNSQHVYYLCQANKGGESYFLSSSKNLDDIEQEVCPQEVVHVSYLFHEPFKCCPNCKQPFDTRLKP